MHMPLAGCDLLCLYNGLSASLKLHVQIPLSTIYVSCRHTAVASANTCHFTKQQAMPDGVTALLHETAVPKPMKMFL